MDQRTWGRVSAYIRQNAIGCVALFLTLAGGTAWATHPGGANTISSTDIINEEVMTADLAERSVTTNRLEAGAVNTGKVLDDNLRSEDILDGQIRAIDVAFGTLRGDEIQDGTIGGNDLVDDGVSGEDVNESTLFNDNSLTTADLATDSVGKGELGPASVGASELGDRLIDRPDPSPTLIDGGVAHNGAYNTAQSTASCNAGEELIGGYGKWAEATSNAELFIVGESLDHTAESATVAGGNDSGDNANLVAVATCLQL